MELIKAAGLLDGILAEKAIEKYSWTLSKSEKQELNLENGTFKLMRTVFNSSASLRVFSGAKMGSVSGNDVTEEGLRKLADDAKDAAESASEDPCHDIAPDQGKDLFVQGTLEPDMDAFIDRIQEFLGVAAKEYPEVNIVAAIGSYDRWNWLSRNSNGTEFEGKAGQYTFFVEICASDGENTTGIDGAGFVTKDLDTPFIEMADVRRHMEDIRRSIKPDTLHGKFKGTLVLTPGAAGEFISMLMSNYMSDGVIINGTSLWLDKVGEQVASDKLTVSLRPSYERIVTGERATGSGFRTEDVTLIDKGVLKAHKLSLYGANKTGRPVVKNTGSDLVIEPGEQSIDEIIAGIKKGLVLGSFSGGEPGTNGEFSGVAKNAFLIEDGKVTKAVTETMVNGNLGEIFKNIAGISKELLADGSSVLPYIAVKGVVISGK